MPQNSNFLELLSYEHPSKAELFAEDNSVEHNKFKYFCYYRSFVKYENEIFPLYLNVGLGINDSKYHLYDITKKIRDTANRINGLERPKPNERYALENDVSSIIITDSAEKINPFDEKSLSEMRGGKLSLRDKLDREALSEAFYGMAESEAEREIVSKYHAEIDDIDDKIDERRRVIQRLEEIEGKSGFGGERARLEGKLKGLNAYITGRDTRLFELESAKPFRDMVERYETELGKKRQSRAKAMGDGQYMYVSRGRYNELMARDPAS